MDFFFNVLSSKKSVTWKTLFRFCSKWRLLLLLTFFLKFQLFLYSRFSLTIRENDIHSLITYLSHWSKNSLIAYIRKTYFLKLTLLSFSFKVRKRANEREIGGKNPRIRKKYIMDEIVKVNWNIQKRKIGFSKG